MLFVSQEKNAHSEDAQPVEIVDDRGRLLAVVSAGEAHRQSLPHRSVLVLFVDREQKVLLAKRPKDAPVFPSRWDLPARGHLQPGEAHFDAARRLADSLFPAQGGLPAFQARLSPTERSDFEALAVYRYPVGFKNDPSERNILAVSHEELAVLAADFRELLTPAVVQAFEAGILFA